MLEKPRIGSIDDALRCAEIVNICGGMSDCSRAIHLKRDCFMTDLLPQQKVKSSGVG